MQLNSFLLPRKLHVATNHRFMLPCKADTEILGLLTASALESLCNTFVRSKVRIPGQASPRTVHAWVRCGTVELAGEDLKSIDPKACTDILTIF